MKLLQASRRICGVFIGCWFVSLSLTQAATLPMTATALQYRENCGLNAAIVTLSLFSKEFSAINVLKALNIGPLAKSPATFTKMLGVFQSHNIAAEAFESASVQDIFNAIDNRGICIVQVKFSSEFHVFVLSAGSFNNIRLDDYPSLGINISREGFIQKFGDKFTGKIIIAGNEALQRISGKIADNTNLAESPSKKISTEQSLDPENLSKVSTDNSWNILSGDSIKVQSTVDLGYVVPGSTEAKGQIVIHCGEKPVEIIGVKGTCSCFTGGSGWPAKLNPHEVKTLEVHFSPQKMPRDLHNILTSSIAILTNDPKLPAALIVVKGKYENKGGLAVVPLRINVGKINSDEFLKKTWDIEVSSKEKLQYPRQKIIVKTGDKLSASIEECYNQFNDSGSPIVAKIKLRPNDKAIRGHLSDLIYIESANHELDGLVEFSANVK